MTREEKDLVLRDLCSRLPYGVKIHYTKHPNSSVDEDTDDTVQGYYSNLVVGGKTDYCLDRCKPYLRPMSSMTENEETEFDVEYAYNRHTFVYETYLSKMLDWLNAHHFDYRGLIEQGLAIEVTEDNNPYKNN